MIHRFETNGIKLVVDVNSGAVHVIDDLVWDLLSFGPEFDEGEIQDELKDKYKKTQISEALLEIQSLITEGMLYSKWDGGIPKMKGEPVIKAMCLHAAHDCNLRCDYCFASTGDFKGDRGLLDFKTGKKALEFLVSHSGHRKNLEVDFFGGEPLMNFQTIKKLVTYGRELEIRYDKQFKFTVTTNGLNLNDEMIDFINSEFVNVVISIDGRKEVHDNMRKAINGKGSYDIIEPKARVLADKRKHRNYYIRGTFTKYNLDFDKDVLHLAGLGYKQISIEPVVAPASMDYALKPSDLEEVYSSYDRLMKAYIERRKNGRGFNFFHFNVDLSQGPCAAKRATGCGAGGEYIAVTPTGDVYPCHQFAGEEEHLMGNVVDGSFDPKKQQVFRTINVFTKEKCSGCWARFYCSGGCAANAYHFNDTIDEPYELGCEMEKKRLECALAIKAIEEIGIDQ
ncbi:MAG TPA: thioether cross-link-forming SCIFF peptide maturase [Bacillota bacterium]|nr:thioether cross-link-forming SCIFF peptide maturase [Bacillota bacterium]